MARTVREIMNRELFGVRPEERLEPTLEAILELGITAVPVLDEERRPLGVVSLRDLVSPDKHARRMTTPAATIPERATISDAGKALAAANVHHLVVVDKDGRATGMVSSLDIIRGLLGVPVKHPAAFPHRDERFGISWTDDTELDAKVTSEAPDAPGVLVLSEGGAGRLELMLWVESATSVRARLDEMLSIPQSDVPYLERILRRNDLRVRWAVVADPAQRDRIAAELREALAHFPLPQASVIEPETR
jgi:CBS domain-containing protein